MLEVVATTPSRPFGACAVVRLDMRNSLKLSQLLDCRGVEGGPPQLTFIRQNWRTFQPRGRLLVARPNASDSVLRVYLNGPLPCKKPTQKRSLQSYRWYTSLPGMAAS